MRKITQLVQAVKDHAAKPANQRKGWDFVTEKCDDSEIETALVNNGVTNPQEAVALFDEVVNADLNGRKRR